MLIIVGLVAIAGLSFMLVKSRKQTASRKARRRPAPNTLRAWRRKSHEWRRRLGLRELIDACRGRARRRRARNDRSDGGRARPASRCGTKARSATLRTEPRSRKKISSSTRNGVARAWAWSTPRSCWKKRGDVWCVPLPTSRRRSARSHSRRRRTAAGVGRRHDHWHGRTFSKPEPWLRLAHSYGARVVCRGACGRSMA